VTPPSSAWPGILNVGASFLDFAVAAIRYAPGFKPLTSVVSNPNVPSTCSSVSAKPSLGSLRSVTLSRLLEQEQP
jgi:hypothetical protein